MHKGDTLVVVGEDCAFYPDQVIFCDPRDFGPLLHEIHHPKVVVEVLSRSTADWDRGGKFDHYRELASLREYVVVHTERQVVDLYARQEDGSWLLTRHGPGEAMALASVGVSVSVGALYEAVAGGG